MGIAKNCPQSNEIAGSRDGPALHACKGSGKKPDTLGVKFSTVETIRPDAIITNLMKSKQCHIFAKMAQGLPHPP